MIARGAESMIYETEWEGVPAVVKERVCKGYRIAELDEELRRMRTRKEAKLLTEARKCGVPTPKLLHVDEKSYKLVMERIDGPRLKELLNQVGVEEAHKLCERVGELVAKLHEHGIVHGDLTTSNMILKNNQIYFIDFGLGSFSNKLEDQGVDMNLLQEALRSTHFQIFEECWRAVVRGYRNYCRAEAVLHKAVEIERRARYARQAQG